MQAIETTASFNEEGELIIDNLPIIKNQKVKLLILLEETEQNEWFRFSGKGLSAAYSEQEPSYTLNMIKKPNPDYKP
ncbi:hypothetical protein [Daejeonella sp.]|uniref:hypothetical protein n=1 Tax=Daejeonella sp. TaxID=2805397 RepID=UPI0027313F0F|nr:hypothetical protein [Daejeonella sp.]MDP2414483.1 hypothetical protein [Daejeonella sp.]